MNELKIKYFGDMRAVGTGPVQCNMGHDGSCIREVCHVGDHSWPTPIMSKLLFKDFRCFSLSVMEEKDVIELVKTLLASMKSLLDRSLTHLKRISNKETQV